MTNSIIQGEFSTLEAEDLISAMIDLKIRFHEDRITRSSNLEDISHRESRIRELQQLRENLRKLIRSSGDRVSLNATLSIAGRKSSES